MNVHLQTGQRYWLPDEHQPYFNGGKIGDGFNDYVVEESGYITLAGKGLPYCVISESVWFSDSTSDEMAYLSETKVATKEQLWKKYVTEQLKYHRKSFAKFGWKDEEKLPPA